MRIAICSDEPYPVHDLIRSLIEARVYRPLARNAGPTALLAVFVAALGIGIAGENAIRLLWGANTQSFYGPTKEPYTVWDAIFINFDVAFEAERTRTDHGNRRPLAKHGDG